MLRKVKEKNVLTQRDGVEKVVFAIFFAILAVQIITILVPLFFMFTNSFKGPAEFIMSKLWDFPKKWLYQNWKTAFTSLVAGGVDAGTGIGTAKASFIVMLFNSLWQTCVRATILALTPMLVGYVYARYDFHGKKAVMAIHLFTMTLPLFGSVQNVGKIAWRKETEASGKRNKETRSPGGFRTRGWRPANRACNEYYLSAHLKKRAEEKIRKSERHPTERSR